MRAVIQSGIRLVLACQACASDGESTVLLMRELTRQRKWPELIAECGQADFPTWPAEFADKTAEALRLRGQAHAFTKNGRQAEADFKLAVKLSPRDAAAWLAMAENYASNLNDDEHALDAYRQVLAITGRSNGWESRAPLRCNTPAIPSR